MVKERSDMVVDIKNTDIIPNLPKKEKSMVLQQTSNDPRNKDQILDQNLRESQ